MKFFVVAVILAVAVVSAEEKERSYGGSSYSKPAAPSYSAPAAPSYSAPAPAAPAYAPSSYSAPPCPKNYLFSCGPSVQPVGCSAPSYGSSGAYSTNYQTYAAAPQTNLMGAYSTNYASYAPAPQYYY